MILTFDTQGNEKQKECAIAWNDPNVTEIIYGGSKGSAKSFTGANLIFHDALVYPNTHYFIARKELNDLRKFTLPTVYEVFGIWGIDSRYYKYNGQDNYFQMYNGSKVFLLAAKYLPSDPTYQRFGSMAMTRGWIEEAGEFVRDCKNNLAISIGRWKNKEYNLVRKLLQTCNPSKNYLYKDYKKNQDGILEPYKRFIQALPYDNKCLPDGYLENLEQTLTGSEKLRLLEGYWEYDDDPKKIIEYEALIDLFTNEHVEQGKSYLTVDVARFGADKSVIYRWDGWRLIEKVELLKNTIPQLVEQVKLIANKHKIPMSQVIADEDGVGGGLVDSLKCKGFLNGSRPINTKEHEKYKNLRTQCWFKAAEKINNHEAYVSIDDHDFQEKLVEELEQIKQKSIESDQIREIISKQDIKSIINRSTDYADPFMMRAYFELKPSQKLRSHVHTNTSNYGYRR